MAYGYGRRRATRSRYRSTRTSYSRTRRPVRRRRRTARARTQKIVIQVVGGPAGVATSPISIGMKSARPVRRRF